MKLAGCAPDDPERLVELEKQLDQHMGEILSEASDAGYSTAEVLMAFEMFWEHQYTALAKDPDPADDPA